MQKNENQTFCFLKKLGMLTSLDELKRVGKRLKEKSFREKVLKRKATGKRPSWKKIDSCGQYDCNLKFTLSHKLSILYFK